MIVLEGWMDQYPSLHPPLEGNDDDDVYLRLQHGKGFHDPVYMSCVKNINPACKA
jgi:hypothetical protein